MTTPFSRDDFPEPTKRALGARVNHRCSNPDCRAPTSGPQVDPSKAVNLGVAAHITAAAPGGPRYDPSLAPEQRADITNGIWLCQTCAKLVDNDPARFTADTIREWKSTAERAADVLVGKTAWKRDEGRQIVDKWVSLAYTDGMAPSTLRSSHFHDHPGHEDSDPHVAAALPYRVRRRCARSTTQSSAEPPAQTGTTS